MTSADTFVTRSDQALTPAETDAFVENGYLMVREAIPRAQAEALRELFWKEAPLNLDDSASWTQSRAALERSFDDGPARGMWSERVCRILDILLGAGRYYPQEGTGWILYNLPGFAALPWQPPTQGWHIDGLHFQHHVDSREQGLVGLFLYTDIEPGGGATVVRPGSHRFASRILQEAEPDGLELWELCRRVEAQIGDLPIEELPGQAGDLLLMHPHLLHNGSANCRPRVRIASNVCIGLREAMNLNRSDPADYSLVERSIVDAIAPK